MLCIVVLGFAPVQREWESKPQALMAQALMAVALPCPVSLRGKFKAPGAPQPPLVYDFISAANVNDGKMGPGSWTRLS